MNPTNLLQGPRNRALLSSYRRAVGTQTTSPPSPGANTSSMRRSGNCFQISTFNMLAPCYKRLPIVNASTGHRYRESSDESKWRQRAMDTLKFFEDELFNSSSIIALQEFWLQDSYASMFREEFQKHGYDFFAVRRTGGKLDAVAICIDSAQFTVLGSESITLCSAGDRVALLIWLKHKLTGYEILVANTHLSFPHNNFEQRGQMRQMQTLTAVMDRFSRDNGIKNVPVIVTGDFNVEGDSLVCKHLRDIGYLSGLDEVPPFFKSHMGDKYLKPLSHQVPSIDHHAESQGIGTRIHLKSCVDRRISISEFHSGRDSKSTEHDSLLNWSHSGKIMDSKYSFVKFVSHRTHRNEDVGVDHIFYKSPQLCSEHGLCLAHKSHSHSDHLVIYDQNNHNSIAPTNVSSNSASHQSPQCQCKLNTKGSITALSSMILPPTLPFHVWDTRFAISDHRPFSVLFQFD